MFFRGPSQLVQDAAGLDSRESPSRIDLQDPVHILGKIDYHRRICGLPGKAGAPPARDDRCPVTAADRNSAADILVGSGDYDSDRHLTVVRSVSRVEGAVAITEPDLAFQRPCEFCRQ